METEESKAPSRASSPSALICNDVVQILRMKAGRGPVKAKTHISGDLVSVVMHDTLTTAEQTLANNGEWPRVEILRLKMQGIMQDDFVASVEKHMGRKVIAFTSANHREPDLAIENFVLEPAA